mmetsp:Transcript_53867/g.127166  ORF Transcript_53867/g.127166 Transcript_53867/m.127166 type:complete len:724 (+) Transcript_53867:16-2187(+)
MADAATAPATVTQSAAKKCRAKAEKATKRKPDPEGIKKFEEGDEALKAKDFAKAKECFDAAEALCAASSAVSAKPKGPKDPTPKATKPAAAATAAEEEPAEEENPVKVLKHPRENTDARGPGLPFARNSPELLAAHLEATGGKWRTRFPPEPNGYLHIGHAKAMGFNFGLAKSQGGDCVMRFDDTNPTAEKQEYIDSILGTVKFLGHTPLKITYTSDYFQTLHDLAIKLIQVGGAYVCHHTKEDSSAARNKLKLAQRLRSDLAAKYVESKGVALEEARALVKRAAEGDATAQGELKPFVDASCDFALPEGAASRWRDRSVEENLVEFNKMSTGRYAEGEAVLRMRCELTSDNPNMWDLAAYRVLHHAHPRTKDTWCVYPTYDYSHCIVDSLENVTHSLCTLEFGTRQLPDGPYYWVLYKLGLYRPQTWEYSRCNITYTVLSKRRLNQLVSQKHVHGWDDPRMPTVSGLKRRGYTAAAINNFCQKVGVTRANNTARMQLLESCIRDELNETAPRVFALVNPVEVEIVNFPEGGVPCRPAPFSGNPKDEKGMGSRDLPFTRRIFIDRADVRGDASDSNFFGLAPGKQVRLLFSFNIQCVDVDTDADGNVVKVRATVDTESTVIPKGKLQWLSADHCAPCEIRLYDYLFNREVPGKRDDGKEGETKPDDDVEEEEEEEGGSAPTWLEDINPDSLIVAPNALVEPAVRHTAAQDPDDRGSTAQTMLR